ncbi:MAG: hypothetical protein V4819_09135 [Verrucomicrobiota bacterium]
MAFLEYVPKVILLVCLCCVIGIAVGYPAAQWLGARFAEILSCLPKEKFSKPQPALGIPASKAVRGDLAGAVEAYEVLLLSHPEEKEIYCRLLEIVLGPMKLDEYGEDVLQRGMKNLATDGERLVLLKLSQSLRNGEYHPFKYLEHDAAPEIKILPPLFGKLREQ